MKMRVVHQFMYLYVRTESLSAKAVKRRKGKNNSDRVQYVRNVKLTYAYIL